MLSSLEERKFGLTVSPYWNRLKLELRSRSVLELSLRTQKFGSQHENLSFDVDRTEERYILSSSKSGGVGIFDLEQRHVRPENCVIKPLVSSIWCARGWPAPRTVRWWPTDNGMFTTSSCKGDVSVYDTNELHVVEQFRLNFNIRSHSVSDTGVIAAAGKCADIVLCDVNTGSTLQRIRTPCLDQTSVLWSPRDSWLLASFGEDGRAFLWDIRRMRVLHAFGVKHPPSKKKRKVYCSADFNASIIFSDDGRELFCVCGNGVLRRFDACTGKPYEDAVEMKLSLDCDMWGRSMSVSRGTRHRMLFVPTNPISIWDVDDNKLVGSLLGHYKALEHVYFLNSTCELLSAGEDQGIFLWGAAGPGTQPSEVAGGDAGSDWSDENA